MIQQTSLQAYTELKKDGQIGYKVLVYLDALSTVISASDREIRQKIYERLGEWWELGTVSARRNNAIELGLVTEAGEAVDPVTGKTVVLWSRKHI